MTLTLYHCKNARSLRALWMLEEMGLGYDLRVLPFPPRMFQKEYLGVNPLGTIPYLIDGDTRMTESSGICHYLGERYGARAGRTDLTLKPEDPDYGAYLNWMFYSDATLTFPQTIVLRYTQLEPPERRLAQAAADYRAFFYGRLRLTDAALRDKDYLVANRFTAADICVGYAIFLAKWIGIAEDIPAHLNDYWARLEARPAFQRAVAKK